MATYPQIYCKTKSYRDVLSQAEIDAIEHEMTLFEQPQAAAIEALKVVQANRGWISDDSLFAIADLLTMSVEQLDSVATFYNLIYRQPVGKHVIHLCDSISCYLSGYESLYQTISQHLAIEYGQTTDDGLFTLLSNACLGSCDKAPAMTINGEYYENLTNDKAITILDAIRSGRETEDLA